VDFEKAYDFVDRKYLQEVMVKMNFKTLWRKCMMECVMMMASVLVNGSLTSEFKLEKGYIKEIICLPFFLVSG